MIKSQNVEIVVNKRNLKKLKKFKNNLHLKIGERIEIPISYLDEGSHLIVECVCDKCGKEKKIMYQKYIKNIKNGGYYSCSSKCSQEKVKKTSMLKYGEEYYMKTEKYLTDVKKTNMEKYGSEYFLSSIEGRCKVRDSIRNKLGVDNPFESDLVKNKIKNTNLERWGVDNVSKSDEIKSKIGEKNSENWKFKYQYFYKENHNLDIIKYEFGSYEIKCSECNKIFEINKFLLSNRIQLNTKICTICNSTDLNKKSGQEIKIFEYIKSIYNGRIETNVKTIISPYEIDIFLPDLKMGIEFNGLYWHSDKFKEKNYHYLKHKKSKNAGIDLFQIWEDDWVYKTDIVKSIISNKLKLSKNKIFARNCEIKLTDSISANHFLRLNHLQGSSKSPINIGLYFNGDLVSLMSFSRLRLPLGSKKLNTQSKYELNRFCNKTGLSVPGSASKIIKSFLKNYECDELISYFDKSLGTESFYEKIGFRFISETPINYYYIKNGLRLHRYNFNKKTLVKMGFNSSLTESQITNYMGLLKIYGPGNYKYSLTKE